MAYGGLTGQAIIEGKYDDALHIAYYSSPGDLWVPVTDEPSIGLNPPLGSIGAKVIVNGTGFAPESLVYLYYDSELVNQTLSDGHGSFLCSFRVPPSAKGPHLLRAIDQLENSAIDFFDVFMEAPPVVGDLNNDNIVNYLDAILLGANFGKSDPNIDAQPSGGYIMIPIIATVGAVPLSVYAVRRKKSHNRRV